MNNRLERILDALASVKLTLVCLGLLMVLVVLGTLGQAAMGTFAAQQKFFNSFWVTAALAPTLQIPIFPGGLLVGSVWFVNLVASFLVRFKYGRKDIGIWLTHLGLLVLLLGQFFAQTLSRENQMPIELGQTRNYAESSRLTELAFVKVSDPQSDEVISVPYSLLSRSTRIESPRLPFVVLVKKFFPNSSMGMGSSGPSMATQGVGTRVEVKEEPVTTADDEMNTVSAYLEILSGNQSLGTWLVSSGLGAPQSFTVNGQEYQIYIRSKRTYYPFSLTLKEFHHDIYPGTDIPKNFSSLVHLQNPLTGESRDALIYMNHPLRYGGLTFYQASFGKNDTLSVFQVVKNPAWVSPYVACGLVVLGLAIQFLLHLAGFVRTKS